MKFKTWRGDDLKGVYWVSYKIDGVRVQYPEKISRAGKILYNLPDMPDGTYEVYLGSFKDTISAVKTKNGFTISPKDIYRLEPIDQRLSVGFIFDPKASYIRNLMAEALSEGYEGLILTKDELRIKVKPKETYDVYVIGTVEGKGKHQGKMGALVTTMGKVGTGFTDEERKQDWLGRVIEVECMHLTEAGKFRHPRFLRERWDKTE